MFFIQAQSKHLMHVSCSHHDLKMNAFENKQKSPLVKCIIPPICNLMHMVYIRIHLNLQEPCR